MSNHDNLISLVENATFERDKARNEYDQLKVKYDSLKKSYNILNSTFAQTRELSLESINIKNQAEKKLREHYDKMLETEKKYYSVANKAERLVNENNLLNNQIEHFKIIFDEMESRKTAEIKCLETTLQSQRTKLESEQKENDENKKIIGDLNFKIKQLQEEKATLKNDIDHLTKIIENSNLTVQTAEEKSKQIDNTIKTFQKQINEANLEKEKLNLKINMQSEQMNLTNEKFNKILSEKNESFDIAITEIKDKYESILAEKSEEFNLLKGDLISMKIERDKYLTEYNIVKNEIEKMSATYREENEKNVQKHKESEQNAIRLQNHFQDKLRLINERNEQLEKENKILLEKVKEYQEQEKKKENLYGRLSKNEAELNEEISKINNKANTLEKENFNLKKQLTKLEIKYKELENSSEIRIKALSSTLKGRNEIYKNIENKVYEIFVEQEGITKKMGNEYMNLQEKEISLKGNFDKSELMPKQVPIIKTNDDEY